MKKLLVANRGEIAVRVMHAAAELGIRTVAVFSEDDAQALHRRRADESVALRGTGVPPYLDVTALLQIACDTGCDAVHPGYGFLSEDAAFARRSSEAGITFVGPSADTLELLGDKTRARELAKGCNVPVLKGSSGSLTASAAKSFLDALGDDGAMVIKAVAGGGGRGMRVVRFVEQVDEAYARCTSEAQQAFGNGSLYVEELMPHARHIEIQIIGDAGGAIRHLGERECSIQRRHQKLVEIAPCPSLSSTLRGQLNADAVRLARAARYYNAGTFEFLVDANEHYAFIEANPRLQVEHTVTEEVYGLDLVRIQLALASGASLADLHLEQPELAPAHGYAIQVRINCETTTTAGITYPASGIVTALALPSGHGVRTDTAAYVGYQTNPSFDSLLAKLIGHSTSSNFPDAVARTLRALNELDVAGVTTNIQLLRRLLQHPDFLANRIDTTFVEQHLAQLIDSDDAAITSPGGDLFELGSIRAPMRGTIVSISVSTGDAVHRGQALLVMNAMKMEHVLEAPESGVVQELRAQAGDTVDEGQTLLIIAPGSVATHVDETLVDDPTHTRADLAETQRRHALTSDATRPAAVERRRKTGQRTARENLDDLCDPGSFVEYGGLAIAAQRQRRELDDLLRNTPADGMIAGIGGVNGTLFGESRSRCAILSYDYTVLAGTQGFQNHRKKDRMFELIERLRLPVIFFTEGGGGRPGDTDAPGVAGLDCMAFHLFGGLSGLVPLLGINSGRCFAGNAALLGCCDVVIATDNSNIGMGGPAMIEGGGLGVFRPEEVGPMNVQVPNGVVDVAVADEAAAVAVAKRYLSYFQGSLNDWQCADQRALRGIIPENRLRVYEVRNVIEALADNDSVLELRRNFGLGMVTALARIEGRPLGILANNPKHLAGAIDAAAADKAARFMQLCDAFDIPLLFLCDTPGIMVGPEAEKTALVRHCSRMFVTGASLTVPFFTIVLRKSYGLGAQAMAGGSHKATLFTVSWPTGEFGGMGLEGAVKLGFRKELAAIEDPAERDKVFQHMVKRAYEHGQALNTAAHFEIDDVIDPAQSRTWIVNALRSSPAPAPRQGKKRPCIDTW